MNREKRVEPLEAEVEPLYHENCLHKDAVYKLELDLSSRVSEVSSLQSLVAALESRSTVSPVKLQSLTNECDWYGDSSDHLLIT